MQRYISAYLTIVVNSGYSGSSHGHHYDVTGLSCRTCEQIMHVIQSRPQHTAIYAYNIL